MEDINQKKQYGIDLGKQSENKIRKITHAPIFDTAEAKDSQVISVNTSTNQFGGNISGISGHYENQYQMIRTYRMLSQQSDVEDAVQQISTEATNTPQGQIPVELEIYNNEGELESPVKQTLLASFKKVSELCKLRDQMYDLFRRWYIDSKLYFYVDGNEQEGLTTVRYIDPLKLKKIVFRSENRIVGKAYLYSENGFSSDDTNEYSDSENAKKENDTKKLKNGWSNVSYGDVYNADKPILIKSDSIIEVDSGSTNVQNNLTLGYLQRAHKHVNVLNYVESSAVIYRISRASERRVFNIDVGNVADTLAEDRMKKVIDNLRNSPIFNMKTGEVEMQGGRMVTASMQEDFYFAKKPGQDGSSVETLDGGNNVDKMEDIKYFRQNLYRSLNIPISRLDSDNGSTFGKDSEISQQEQHFNHFIVRLRRNFSKFMLDMMRIDLILKKDFTLEEFKQIEYLIGFSYIASSYFDEVRQREMLDDRLNSLRGIQPEWIGTFFSVEYMRKNILKMSEEEIQRMDAQIEEERAQGVLDKFKNAMSPPQFNDYGDIDKPDAPDAPDKPDNEMPNLEKPETKRQTNNDKQGLVTAQKRANNAL